MKHRFLILALALLLGGCGKAAPTQAGGKPVSFWVQALQQPNAKLRKTAVFKLGNVGPADPAALPAVLGALRDPDPIVRCEAILAVMKFGSAAKEAVPLLTDIRQHDPHAKARDYATKALDKIEPAS
jgi:HEAT repeat protein